MPKKTSYRLGDWIIISYPLKHTVVSLDLRKRKFTMFRLLTICILFTAAALCHGDDPAAPFANAEDSNAREGWLRDASPAELQQLSKIDEATRKFLSKYMNKASDHISREFDKYEARIAQLEDELASRSKSNPQPLNATPTPVFAPAKSSRYAPSPAPYGLFQVQASTSSPIPLPNRPAKTWQRVNLHGQWLYIVPVEHVDAFAPPQPK